MEDNINKKGFNLITQNIVTNQQPNYSLFTQHPYYNFILLTNTSIKFYYIQPNLQFRFLTQLQFQAEIKTIHPWFNIFDKQKELLLSFEESKIIILRFNSVLKEFETKSMMSFEHVKKEKIIYQEIDNYSSILKCDQYFRYFGYLQYNNQFIFNMFRNIKSHPTPNLKLPDIQILNNENSYQWNQNPQQGWISFQMNLDLMGIRNLIDFEFDTVNMYLMYVGHECEQESIKRWSYFSYMPLKYLQSNEIKEGFLKKAIESKRIKLMNMGEWLFQMGNKFVSINKYSLLFFDNNNQQLVLFNKNNTLSHHRQLPTPIQQHIQALHFIPTDTYSYLILITFSRFYYLQITYSQQSLLFKMLSFPRKYQSIVDQVSALPYNNTFLICLSSQTLQSYLNKLSPQQQTLEEVFFYFSIGDNYDLTIKNKNEGFNSGIVLVGNRRIKKVLQVFKYLPVQQREQDWNQECVRDGVYYQEQELQKLKVQRCKQGIRIKGNNQDQIKLLKVSNLIDLKEINKCIYALTTHSIIIYTPTQGSYIQHIVDLSFECIIGKILEHLGKVYIFISLQKDFFLYQLHSQFKLILLLPIYNISQGFALLQKNMENAFGRSISNITRIIKVPKKQHLSNALIRQMDAFISQNVIVLIFLTSEQQIFIYKSFQIEQNITFHRLLIPIEKLLCKRVKYNKNLEVKKSLYCNQKVGVIMCSMSDYPIIVSVRNGELILNNIDVQKQMIPIFKGKDLYFVSKQKKYVLQNCESTKHYKEYLIKNLDSEKINQLKFIESIKFMNYNLMVLCTNQGLIMIEYNSQIHKKIDLNQRVLKMYALQKQYVILSTYYPLVNEDNQLVRFRVPNIYQFKLYIFGITYQGIMFQLKLKIQKEFDDIITNITQVGDNKIIVSQGSFLHQIEITSGTFISNRCNQKGFIKEMNFFGEYIFYSNFNQRYTLFKLGDSNIEINGIYQGEINHASLLLVETRLLQLIIFDQQRNVILMSIDQMKKKFQKTADLRLQSRVSKVIRTNLTSRNHILYLSTKDGNILVIFPLYDKDKTVLNLQNEISKSIPLAGGVQKEVGWIKKKLRKNSIREKHNILNLKMASIGFQLVSTIKKEVLQSVCVKQLQMKRMIKSSFIF